MDVDVRDGRLEKLGELDLGKPDRLVFEAVLDAGVAIFGLVEDERGTAVAHIDAAASIRARRTQRVKSIMLNLPEWCRVGALDKLIRIHVFEISIQIRADRRGRPKILVFMLGHTLVAIRRTVQELDIRRLR